MNEPTKANERKALVERYLAKLSAQDPNLYYASTNEVARGVHTMLKEHTNRMTPEEQQLVRKLSIEDVAVILGFH